MSDPIVRCGSCGQRNRIVVARLDQRGTCGRCQSPLPAWGQPLEVDRLDDLRRVLETSPIPVLVDFWASWCGPCRMVAPHIAQVAERRAGAWLVVKANTEVDPGLGARFGIRSIPTMAVYDRGHELARQSGAQGAQQIERFVAQALTQPH